MKILAFGEVLWDIYETNEYLGGASMNFAAHCKNCGADSWIVTAVGDDELGKRTVEEISRLGIYTEFITVSEKETGKCYVTLDSNMIPSYNLLDNVAYDDILVPDLKNRNFDVLYFGTLALRNENNRNTLKKMLENSFGDVFVDVNIRKPFYSEEVVEFAFENATIIKISDEELPVIMDVLSMKQDTDRNSAEMLAERYGNLKLIIITKGDKGSIIYDTAIEKTYECKSAKVDVVSTVGAGDSFSASFLVKYLRTGDIEKALELATAISGYVVSCEGAIPEYSLSDFE